MKAAVESNRQDDLLFVLCLFPSVLSLGGGYALARLWWGVGLTLLLALPWIHAKRSGDASLAAFCLAASSGLGAVGLLVGVPFWLAATGITAALGAWDLVFLAVSQLNCAADEKSRRYASRHVGTLLPALGGGLAAALAGSLLSLQIPFILMLACGVVVVIGLDLTWARLIKGVK